MVAQIDKTYIQQRPGKIWTRLTAYALFEGRPLTTRGQFINPALQKLYSLLSRLPVLKPVEKPVFIIGTGRSGTTVLGKVLSIHRDVGFLNEPKILWNSAFENEDLIGSYSQNPPKVRMSDQDVTPDASRVLHRLHGAYLRLSGAGRLVDKYPELVFRTKCVLGLYPDAKFVFISRNGWDTAASIKHWSERLGTTEQGETHDWWGRDDRKWLTLVDQLVASHDGLRDHLNDIRKVQDHTLRAAIEWVLSMQEGLRLQSELPAHTFLHVEYEALCAQPAQQIARILEFSGLSQDQVCLTYADTILKPVRPYQQDMWPDWFAPIFQDTQDRLDLISTQGNGGDGRSQT